MYIFRHKTKKSRFIIGFPFIIIMQILLLIVVLTANALTGEKEKYIEKGFDDYLAKPIEKLELYRVLKKYLNK